MNNHPVWSYGRKPICDKTKQNTTQQQKPHNFHLKRYSGEKYELSWPGNRNLSYPKFYVNVEAIWSFYNSRIKKVINQDTSNLLVGIPERRVTTKWQSQLQASAIA